MHKILQKLDKRLKELMPNFPTGIKGLTQTNKGKEAMINTLKDVTKSQFYEKKKEITKKQMDKKERDENQKHLKERKHKLKESNEKLSKSKAPKWDDHNGILCASYESGMKNVGATPQAYFGGKAFTGPMSKKLSKNFNSAVVPVQKIAETIKFEQSDQIQTWIDTHVVNFEILVECLNSFSHCKPVVDQEIHKAEHLIDRYLQYQNKTWPDMNMIFKKHDLKFHIIPTMKSYGCGIGIFSEQAAGQ
jgi:hypothetical protein